MSALSTYKDSAGPHDATEGLLSVDDIIAPRDGVAADLPTPFAQGRYRARTLCPHMQYFDCDLNTLGDLNVEGQFSAGLCIGLAFEGGWRSMVGDRDISMAAGQGAVVYGAGRDLGFAERQPAGGHIRMASLYVGADLLATFGAGTGLPQALSGLLDRDGLSLRRLAPCPTLRTLFEEMYRNPCDGYLDHLRMNGLALGVLTELARLDDDAAASCSPRQRDMAHAVRAYLDGNLAALPVIADVAASFGTSESSLRRVFKSVFGVGLAFYVREKLLNQARLQVREGRLQIAEIAYRCGFSDPANFTAAYRRHFGRPPSADRSGR